MKTLKPKKEKEDKLMSYLITGMAEICVFHMFNKGKNPTPDASHITAKYHKKISKLIQQERQEEREKIRKMLRGRIGAYKKLCKVNNHPELEDSECEFVACREEAQDILEKLK